MVPGAYLVRPVALEYEHAFVNPGTGGGTGR